MNKYLLGIVGLLALSASGPAGAADLPLKAPPMVAPSFNWNRCYVGVHAGWGWGRDKNDFGNAIASGPTEIFEVTAFPSEFGPFDHNTSGGVVGGQVGCNWQWAPGWLVGIEGELFWSGIKGSFTAPEDATDPGEFSRFESRNIWDADLALRFGHILPGNMDLIYVKGGGVLGRFRYTEWHDDFPTTHSCPFNGNIASLTCSVDVTQTVGGWLVGFGWEHVISIPGSWTFKAEFDFIGYPSHNVAYPSAGAAIQQFAVTDSKAIIKVGVNHYFP